MRAATAHDQIVAPDDLTERDQWVLWRYETRNGKTTKVPYQANGRKASSTDPSTWTTFEAALDRLWQVPVQFDGIGFVFSPADPYCGVDVEGCIDDAGNIKAWARPIIAAFADTYAEISPSGRGVKIFTCAKIPGEGKKVYVDEAGNVVRKEQSHGGIEVYDRGRYFTVTGNTLEGIPLSVKDHHADVTDALQTDLHIW